MEKGGITFAEHSTYGIITTCPTNMGTGKRQSILGKFPNLTKKGTDEKNLKELAKSFNLQARGMGGEHSAMDAEGTADISPSARFGVTEATVAKRLFDGLVELYKLEMEACKTVEVEKPVEAKKIENWDMFKLGSIVYIDDARKVFCNENKEVQWNIVQQRWDYLKPIKESLANKYWNAECS